ncbi:MAG: peptidoglycan-binding domain-containing protein [Afipia sp.]|nr:peptidoglycan-binding domain-containing protein [Afipia sp.]
MPRQIIMDDEKPRRRRSAAVAIEPERGLVMRVLLHSPKDTLAGAAAAIVVFGIVANALFLQPGRHPAPMFGLTPLASPAVPAATQAPIPRVRPSDAEVRSETKPVEQPVISSKPSLPAASAAPPRPPAAIPALKNDPVGDLIVSTRRVAAIQRALTEYGYGQLKPTGVVGPETTAAIQKFERDRKQPVTGQISDRLIRDLVVLTGRPIE